MVQRTIRKSLWTAGSGYEFLPLNTPKFILLMYKYGGQGTVSLQIVLLYRIVSIHISVCIKIDLNWLENPDIDNRCKLNYSNAYCCCILMRLWFEHKPDTGCHFLLLWVWLYNMNPVWLCVAICQEYTYVRLKRTKYNFDTRCKFVKWKK